MKARLLCFASVVVLALVSSACKQESSGLKDGYYTAEGADFDQYGWKEYVTIYVYDGRVITVEYDAFNASGFIKSWDVDYMRNMNTISGTYPKEYARAYAVSLINWQDPSDVDAVTGATSSHKKFQELSMAAIAKSKAGDKHVALVNLPE